jgi:hypothetical protein
VDPRKSRGCRGGASVTFLPSFPRKRESMLLDRKWIPAYAGMTTVWTHADAVVTTVWIPASRGNDGWLIPAGKLQVSLTP